jgi:nitrite reductase/ring-hydroxylating ferredoxin subunit
VAAENEAANEAWTPVIAVTELTDGRAVRVEAFEIDVFVLRVGEATFAIANRCTHQGAPLQRGVVKVAGSEATVTCPAHGSMFSLVDGRVRRGPATQPLVAFEARVSDGMVELRPKG